MRPTGVSSMTGVDVALHLAHGGVSPTYKPAGVTMIDPLHAGAGANSTLVTLKN